MTGSNVINVLKGALVCVCGGGGGGCAWSQSFLLVTDNRRSRLDSPFCVITQHRKFESVITDKVKKISNAQELTMQLSQTLSPAIAQISFKQPNHTKKILPQRPPPFFNFCIT